MLCGNMFGLPIDDFGDDGVINERFLKILDSG